MPNVRGRALLIRAEFVRERLGPAAWRKVEEALGADATARFSRVDPQGWYPMDLYDGLQNAIAGVAGGDRAQLLGQLGIYSADKNAEALFGKLGSDAFEFFKHIAKLHRELFDFGDMKVVRRPGGCLIEVDYAGHAARSVCESAVGFYGRCAELNGARNVSVEMLECQADGGGACLFKISWRKIRRTISNAPR